MIDKSGCRNYISERFHVGTPPCLKRTMRPCVLPTDTFFPAQALRGREGSIRQPDTPHLCDPQFHGNRNTPWKGGRPGLPCWREFHHYQGRFHVLPRDRCEVQLHVWTESFGGGRCW